MKKESPFKIRLNKIKLVNFKCFDEIEIEFPKPFNEDDLDVFVMGSQNGLGKTSVLEAISLLFLTSIFEEFHLPFADYFIKAGKNFATIEGYFEVNDKENLVKLEIKKGTPIGVENFLIFKIVSKEKLGNLLKGNEGYFISETSPIPRLEKLLLSIMLAENEPFLIAPFIYFNSNRIINAKNVQLEDISIDDEFSLFKKEVMKILAAKGGIFEDFSVENSEESLKFLNDLCKEYAQGTFGKVNSVSGDIRVTLTNGGIISLNGLSSGQKEIISTLFLIWKNTKDQSGIVLIDEPELHLNVEWQHKFIRSLKKLLPQNQYILATHSKQIFGSVEPEYRGMLRPDDWEE